MKVKGFCIREINTPWRVCQFIGINEKNEIKVNSSFIHTAKKRYHLPYKLFKENYAIK